ncbi:hypothetical protein JOM56_009579 [Amanita muscaria]
MPPKPVERALSDTYGRFSALADTAEHTSKSSSAKSSSSVLQTSSLVEYDVLKHVSKVYNPSLPHVERAQSFYFVFSELASELEPTSHFTAVMSRIADNLRELGCNPPTPAQPCTLSHDPVTVMVTKEVIKEVQIPTPCTLNHYDSTETKKLRKEISDLRSGISFLYHLANLTHAAPPARLSSLEPPACPSSLPPSESDSCLESMQDINESSDSAYDNTDTVSSTPRVGTKPLPKHSLPIPPLHKSYANAAKTDATLTKSPKEILRNKMAKSCTNKGTPSNVLVLSDFSSANTARSYERIAEMRKKVNNTLGDNKCKSISWSSRGNLVTKCAKPLSDRDKTDIINSAKSTFENNPTVLNKKTVSYVKFIDVPLFDKEGTAFDNNDFNVMIQQSEKWTNVNIMHGPQVVIKKNITNAKKATIKIGFTDDKNSATAKRLLKTTILFGGVPIRCKPWTSVPPAPSRKRAPHASVSPSDAEVSSLA